MTTHSRTRAFLTRRLSLHEIGLAMLALLAALGWSVSSPGKQIAALDIRVARNDKRLDSLAEQQRFTNYMLCVLVRRSDPDAVPPGCNPSSPLRRAR